MYLFNIAHRIIAAASGEGNAAEGVSEAVQGAASDADLAITAVKEQAAEVISNLSDEKVTPSLLDEYLETLPRKATGLLIHIALAIVITVIAWKIIDSLVKAFRRSMERAQIDESKVHFLSMLMNVTLKVLLIFAVAAQLGVNTAGVLALLGSAGVAIGLAIQGTLSNLAGGILILLTKPFTLGDYIIEDTHGHEGTVKEISLFTTKLITADNRLIVLPNGDLANTSLTNSTGNRVRLLSVKVGVSYGTDINKARKVLLSTTGASKYILKDREMEVVVADLADSSVDLSVRCWVNACDYLRAKWTLTENIYNALKEKGIEIAFPQLDVHMT
ncbi:mechanosensitive ion channel family protein [Butyrivibrio sp. MC2013]|uniref:mechanosensitive ion channel family protein n=1 Tax=Butyrivibrio sp. MC2013 TaxID=1280686 RepID=UPI00040BDB78|nr:mechanosensitive ion channel family protein [Butyrivibrio sp. MC2013]